MKKLRHLDLFLLPELLISTIVSSFIAANSVFSSMSYEWSATMGIFGFFFVLFDIPIRLSQLSRSRPIEEVDVLKLSTRSIFAFSVGILLPWIVQHSMGRTCGLIDSTLWLISLAVPPTLFGLGSALFLHSLRRSIAKNVLVSLLPCILYSILTITDLLTKPAVYFHHPIVIDFGGPIYDHWIPRDASTWSFALWVSLVSIFLIRSSRYFHILSRLRVGFFLFLIASPLLARETLGWTTSESKIRSSLGGEISSSIFTLVYDKKFLKEEEASKLFKEVEFQIRLLAERLEIQTPIPLTLFAYGDAQSKKKLLGAGETSLGNPFQKSIHILRPQGLSQHLRHELVHVLAASFSKSWLPISLRPALLEGLATAMEDYRGSLSIHEWAQSMRRLDALPNVESLMRFHGFLLQAPQRAYLASGSFCLFLIERFGMRKFQSIYRGGSFESVYSLSLKMLLHQWMIFLDTRPYLPKNPEIARNRLTQKSVYELRCPHEVAALIIKSQECQRDHQAALLRNAHELSGFDPSTSLEILSILDRNNDHPFLHKFLESLSHRDWPPSKRADLTSYSWRSNILQGNTPNLAQMSTFETYDDPTVKILQEGLAALIVNEDVSLRMKWAKKEKYWKGIPLSSSSLPLLFLRGYMALQEGAFEESILSMDRVLQSSDLNEESSFVALFFKARAMEKSMNLETARSIYMNLAKNGPSEGLRLKAMNAIYFMRLHSKP